MNSYLSLVLVVFINFCLTTSKAWFPSVEHVLFLSYLCGVVICSWQPVCLPPPLFFSSFFPSFQPRCRYFFVTSELSALVILCCSILFCIYSFLNFIYFLYLLYCIDFSSLSNLLILCCFFFSLLLNCLSTHVSIYFFIAADFCLLSSAPALFISALLLRGSSINDVVRIWQIFTTILSSQKDPLPLVTSRHAHSVFHFQDH